MTDIFQSCSGQSPYYAFGKGSRKDWALCLADHYRHLAPWWRSETSNGRRILFATFEEAEHARKRWEKRGWPQSLTDRGILRSEYDL